MALPLDLEQMSPLQLRFTELCIEKRRQLNQLSELTREAKSLQSEIHHLLDVLAEILPIEDYLKNDDWSDDGDDEWAAGGIAFSEYGFLGDSEEEDLLFAERRSFEHLALGVPRRRRSVSPHRRSVSNLQQPDYPIIVGRAVNRVIIDRLGQPDDNGYPRGYKAHRRFVDFNDSSKKILYLCMIDNDGLFSVHSESSNAELAKGNDPVVVWDQLAAKFSPLLVKSLVEEFPNLNSFFGLEHETTKRYIQQFANKN